MTSSDRRRTIVGQTLTHHAAGIEKDLNTLLFEDRAEVGVYLYPDNARSVARIHEILGRARQKVPDQVVRLKLLPYPAEFDPDDDFERAAVRGVLRSQVLDDLVLNVVLGNLTANDIGFFIETASLEIPGLQLALLHRIAVDPLSSVTDLGRQMRTVASLSTVRNKVQSLFMCGLTERPLKRGYVPYRLSRRGWTLLRLCRALIEDQPAPELALVLERLGLEAPGVGPDFRDFELITRPRFTALLNIVDTPSRRTELLVREARGATADLGVTFNESAYRQSLVLDDEGGWIGLA